MAIIPKHDAAKRPAVVPVYKETVTRQTTSRWINVKAHDPNKRIISEIYCAASRVVNSARTAPWREREWKRERERSDLCNAVEERVRIERGNRKREKTRHKKRERVRKERRERREEKLAVKEREKNERKRNGERSAGSKLRWLRLSSFRLTPW